MKRRRIFDIISIGDKSDRASIAFDYFIVAVIFINLTVTFLMTISSLSRYYNVLYIIETITIVIFTIEYILRLWTADFLYPDKSRPLAVFCFVFSFFGLIDLLTILPFYLPFIFPAGAVAFRIFRVFRIFRLFRINARYDAFNVIADVLKEKKSQLISSAVIIFIFMLAASLCMYSLEHDAQPESFKNAFSGMWWAVSTLLTIGYGDIYPVTLLGKIMAAIISFLGVLLVAVPTGIISAGFVEQYTRMKEHKGLEDELKIESIRVGRGHSWTRRELGAVMNEDEALKGKRIKELYLDKNEAVVLIRRGRRVFVPDDTTVIKYNDSIMVLTDIADVDETENKV